MPGEHGLKAPDRLGRQLSPQRSGQCLPTYDQIDAAGGARTQPRSPTGKVTPQRKLAAA